MILPESDKLAQSEEVISELLALPFCRNCQATRVTRELYETAKKYAAVLGLTSQSSIQEFCFCTVCNHYNREVAELVKQESNLRQEINDKISRQGSGSQRD